VKVAGRGAMKQGDGEGLDIAMSSDYRLRASQSFQNCGGVLARSQLSTGT
jgi:hypothetical protein